MADPACGRGSYSTLPKECSLSLPACRGLLLGSPFRFSLTPFAITIYLSLQVEGTRACSLERLEEPERESEEASVWAQGLPLRARGEGTCLQREVGDSRKGSRAGKCTTHTNRAKRTERRCSSKWQIRSLCGETGSRRTPHFPLPSESNPIPSLH